MAKKFFIASLIYFILGLLAQVAGVFDVWLGFNPLAYTAVAATEQIFLLGWLTQLALALSYDRWLAPRLQLPITNPSALPYGRRTSLQSPTLRLLLRLGSGRGSGQVSNPRSPPHKPTSPMVVFVLFNIGLPLVIVGQPGLALFGGDWLGAAAAWGALLQLFAGLVFVRDAWKTLRTR